MNMNEQELRERIVNTITNLNNICRTGCVCKNCKYENYDNCTEYAIADKLIAVGIGDAQTEREIGASAAAMAAFLGRRTQSAVRK